MKKLLFLAFIVMQCKPAAVADAGALKIDSIAMMAAMINTSLPAPYVPAVPVLNNQMVMEIAEDQNMLPGAVIALARIDDDSDLQA